MTVYSHWLRIREQTTVPALRAALADAVAFTKARFHDFHRSVAEGYITKLSWEANHRIAILELMGWLNQVVSQDD